MSLWLKCLSRKRNNNLEQSDLHDTGNQILWCVPTESKAYFYPHFDSVSLLRDHLCLFTLLAQVFIHPKQEEYFTVH